MEKKVISIVPRPKLYRWYVCKAAFGTIPHREKLQNAGFKFFLPTYFEMQNVAGRKVRVEKPSVMNYIFVYADSEELYDFAMHTANLSVVFKRQPLHDKEIRSYDDYILAISDREMQMFMQNVGHYDKAVPFFKPSEIELEKGDYVRIVGGPFEGIEGVLLSTQGKDGGRVMVSVGNLAIVPTLEIEPQYIQVLEFAKKGKHLYKKFDSFIGKAREALTRFYNPAGVEQSLLIKDNATMQQFKYRFGEVKTPTVNARLKLEVYLLICHTCLGEDEKQQKMIEKIKETLLSINSEINRAFALAMMYRCTLDEKYKEHALEITRNWGKPKDKDKMKLEILKDLGVLDEDKKKKKKTKKIK